MRRASSSLDCRSSPPKSAPALSTWMSWATEFETLIANPRSVFMAISVTLPGTMGFGLNWESWTSPKPQSPPKIAAMAIAEVSITLVAGFIWTISSWLKVWPLEWNSLPGANVPT